MKMKVPYLTQYCNLAAEWKRNGIDIDNASEDEVRHIKDLQAKAMEQSGLNRSELALISLCRAHDIFREVNTYSKRLIRF